MARKFQVAALVVSIALGSSVTRALACARAPEVDGGSGGASDCNQDVKKVDASSTCLRSTWCGGAHGGSIAYGGVRVTAPAGGGSVDCCLTELVIPEHTEVVAGHRRIVHGGEVDALLIMRRCSSPFVFLWIDFGSWTCEVDTMTPFGKYPLDTAVDCE